MQYIHKQYLTIGGWALALLALVVAFALTDSMMFGIMAFTLVMILLYGAVIASTPVTLLTLWCVDPFMWVGVLGGVMLAILIVGFTSWEPPVREVLREWIRGRETGTRRI